MAETNLTPIEVARGKTGPNTPQGRARALAARIRGKLPHSAMIVPGVETAEEWEDFRLSIVVEYEPVGALEAELADRIAHQFWRLRRFSRYEAERVAWRMKCAPIEYHRLRVDLTGATHGIDVPRLLPSLPLDLPYLRGPAALQQDALWYASPASVSTPAHEEHERGGGTLVRAAATAAGLSDYKLSSKTSWTVGEVRVHLAAIAKLGHITENELLVAVAAKAGEAEAERAAFVAAQQATYDLALSEFKRTLLLPTESEIRNAARWESHLERSLCRMMDRLERLQRMRAGEFVPAPALLHVATDDG